MADQALRDDFDAFMAGDDYGYDDDPDVELPPPEGAAQANGLLRSIRRLERDAAEIVALYANEVERARRFRDDRLAGIEREIDRRARLLEGFARAHLRGRRTKTQQLPTGTLSLRAGRAKVHVIDERRAVIEAFGFSRGGWVRTKQEIDKTEIAGELFAGSVIVDTDQPAPAGHEWRQALIVDGFDARWMIVLPRVTALSAVRLLWPIEDSFSYKTNKGEHDDG